MIRLAALILSLAGGAASAESGALTLTGSHGELILGPGDMTDAKAQLFANMADVTISLSPSAGTALAAFTSLHVGEEIAILSCGKVLFSPRVIEPITESALTVGGLEITQAETLRDILLGKATCPEGP